jgi:RNA polymerase sigma-70 factor (ECF subfamily)
VSLYVPLVYHWCRRAGLQAADAADIGQEVFRAVARKLGDFRLDCAGDSFRGWLWTITRNKLCDFARSRATVEQAQGGSDAQNRLHQIPEEDAEEDPAQRPEADALLYRRAVDLLQGEFEERTWRAFWEVAIEGRPPAEVAAELGLSVNAVYLAKSRILRRFREEFAGLVPDSGLPAGSS